MSSICAIWNKNSEPAELENNIASMIQSLRPHGPEQSGSIVKGHVALAFGLMKFSRFVETHQPTRCTQSDRVLVLDGRIDNRDELLSILSISGEQRRLISDNHLFLLLWDRFGTDTLLKIHGAFAGLLYDVPNRQLIAFVDPFRQRSLYYSQHGGAFLFASAPKGLFATGVSRVLNRQKVTDALAQYYGNLTSSYFEGVNAIPPGSFLCVSSAGIEIKKYYALSHHIRPVRYKHDRDYVEDARERLARIVGESVQSSGRVGAFLTGGLDSSSVAVTALSQIDSRIDLPTFTMVPEPGSDGITRENVYGDETPFVKSIQAAHPRISPSFVNTSHLDLQSKEMAFFHAAEIPIRNVMNNVWFHAIFEKAKMQGVSVLLSGDAGNYGLSYSGRDLPRYLARRHKYAALFKELHRTGSSPISTSFAFIRSIVATHVPEGLWAQIFRARFGHPGDLRKRTALAPDVFDRHFTPDLLEKADSVAIRDTRSWFIWALEHRYPSMIGDVNRAFETIYGIEQRAPLADRRILEWSLGVPDTQYQRDGETRWLMKRMMKGLLPDSILNKQQSIGGQSVDWHTRLSREKADLERRISMYREFSELSELVDWDQLSALLTNWPKKTIDNIRDAERYMVMLPHALHTAEFVKHFSDKNR